MPNIVVIGAGVSGLTTALLLARDKANTVTVVARHMPGDYDAEYTSPWAGANVLPMSHEADSRYERETWPELKRLAESVPEAGIHFQRATLWRRQVDLDKPRLSDALFYENPWYRDLFDDYRELAASELPPDIRSGATFTSVCINTMLYLPWLVGQCRALGVVFRRAVLAHVEEAAAYGGLLVTPAGTTALNPQTRPAETIVVNCSGLLACRLGGIEDTAVQPARGQVVVIREELEPMLVTSSAGDGVPGELLYSMQRPCGGGTIVGGTYQVGNWDGQPDPNTAARILARIAEQHPQLRRRGTRACDLSIVRHGVGLRPYRAGGVRIEAEKLPGSPNGPWIVHNYGHAGWGYQGSYGCSKHVVELVHEVIAKTSAARTVKASL
ncbi:d-amino acid oxidase [Grosmannia clavigera kw1407]|uniref:D-amino acid oxidase n=1 Tax=Grosmannia clavigera (strain kw1407 / UAMH 11150) TaxID=655863 RepID=F0X8B0_GROCL|nr:d-amino acid oxidase [Grosmannia clavigera kw1407]EFX05875.1 d-amino acid oxidase [Grosmannia clavigera kw1407]